MSPQRRAEIRLIVDFFRGKIYAENLMEEFCNRRKVEPITQNDLEDYTFQADYDERIAKLLPEMTKLLCETRFVPTFGAEKEISEAEKSNKEVHIKISQLIEQAAIPFTMLDKVGGQVARMITDFVEQAGNAVYNKAMFQVILPILREKFGASFNSKHVADFVADKFKKK